MVDVSLFVRQLAIALPLVVLISCTDDADQLGVSLLNDAPAAVWAPCKGGDDPPVVELLLTEDKNPGSGDDQVLWRALPREPSDGPFVTPLGIQPEGYETTIPLNEDLNPSTKYTLYIRPGGGVIVFRPQDLEEGAIKSQIGKLTPERFLENAGEGCESGGGLIEGAEPVILQLEH